MIKGLVLTPNDRVVVLIVPTQSVGTIKIAANEDPVGANSFAKNLTGDGHVSNVRAYRE
jgi:hypothetical protein